MQERDATIDVRPAASGGLGIFACVDFRPGDYIHTVEYEREIIDQNPLNPELGERFEHCAYPDGKVMLVAAPGRYMNHSCDPNAYYRYAGQTAHAHARRAIPRGQEVTVDYLINNGGGRLLALQVRIAKVSGQNGDLIF